MPSLLKRIADLEQRVSWGRYLDLSLELQAPDGKPLMKAGGVWDVLAQDFAKDLPGTPHVIRVTKAQVKAATRLVEWHESYRRNDPDRMALEVYVDMRRGGKTFFSVLAVWLFALMYPRSHLGRTVCWLVVPTYPQQREIQEVVGKILPAAWLREGGPVRYSKSDRAYHLANGARIEIKSADRPELLKAGGVACVCVNEAQQVTVSGIIHVLGSNIDAGGVTMLAMNPPDSVRGLWAENLHDEIEKVLDNGMPALPWARETDFPPAENEAIDQGARKRFSALARVLDPKQEQRDAQGLWVSIKDRCYPLWRRKDHFRPAPEWRDLTNELNAMTGCLMHGDLSRTWGIGMDFQNKPYCAAIRAKAFLAPAGNALGVPENTICYWVLGEKTNDIAKGQWWSEDLLCQEMMAAGWDPKEALVIADGTGAGQGSTGAQRGADADPVTFSFPLVKKYGYSVHGPVEREEYIKHHGRGTEKRIIPSNPRVPKRLDIMLDLLRTNRLLVAPTAPTVAESFRTCEAKNKRPFGEGAHLTDAVGYLLFRWETSLREKQGRRS